MENNEFELFIKNSKEVLNDDNDFFSKLNEINWENMADEKEKIKDFPMPTIKMEKSELNTQDNNVKIKNKKKKKKSRKYSEVLTEKIKENIKKKIDENDKIPNYLKEKYKAIECSSRLIVLYEIPIDISIDEIKNFLEKILINLDKRLLEVDPIVKIDIGETGKFAIIELFDEDFIKIALNVSPVIYKDFEMKIKRTKGFYCKHFANIKITLDSKGMVKPYSTDTTRLYMGNIPKYFREVEIKKMWMSIAPLKTFQLETENYNGDRVSKGYCFFEYADNYYTDIAIEKFDGLQIGDKNLKVHKIEQTITNKIISSINKKEEISFLLLFNKIKNPYIQAMLNVPKYVKIPSRVIQLLNMFSIEELFEEDFYNDLQKDISFELKKFGDIEDIIIPMPLTNGLCNPSVGKVFVKFKELKIAKRARYKINGRTYNRRTVISSFYPEDWFDKKEYIIKG